MNIENARRSAMAIVAIVVAGCGGQEAPVATTVTHAVVAANTHEVFQWKANDYFTEKDVVDFCRAIENDDLIAVQKMITRGVDVNAVGKGNMTPLLWAFPEDRSAIFLALLEAGADPNVVFRSDFTSFRQIRSGQSVTFLSAGSTFKSQFFDIMSHGGDATFISENPPTSLLHEAIRSQSSDRNKRVELLIERGADLDFVDYVDTTPTIAAVLSGGQFNLALTLLNAGADWRVYQNRNNAKLVHFVVREENNTQNMSRSQKHAYRTLVEFLIEQGESFGSSRNRVRGW